MANVVFNIAKGRIAELAALGAANDALILVLLNSSGLEADATLIDYDTLAAITGAANDEMSFSGYARRTLASVTVTVDDTNNRVDVDAADPSAYTNADAGVAAGAAIVCYDGDTTGGNDTNIVPLVKLDCSVTFDTGVATTLSFNSAGFFRAS